MTVSVIVPVYNNPEGLARCLASLTRLDDKDFEVIVVDDGSAESHEHVCAMFGARFVRLPENAGPGVARNEGAKCARGEILAFTDSDCVVPSDWLSKIRNALRPGDMVAVAGTFDRSIGDTFIGRQRLFEARFYHLKERCSVNSFTTSNFAIKASVFKQAGGFPPLRIAEDLLLGYKLMRLGYGVLWLYDLQVSQEFRSSLWKYFKQQAEWISNILLLTMYYPELQLMKWSVKRSGLLWQLGLQSLLVALIPFYRLTREWAIFLLMMLGVLVILNWPFLRFSYRQRSLLFAAQLFATTVLIRNIAWLVGLGRVFVRSPVQTISRLGLLLMTRIRPTCRPELDEPLPSLGNKLAPGGSSRGGASVLPR